MNNLDPRLNPFRNDLAADHLRGQVTSQRFVAGQRRCVFDGAADIRRSPIPDAPLDTEALHGEIFTVFEDNDEGWSWGQLARDGYVGYMPSNALVQNIDEPTHRVTVLRTFLYGGPSIKLPPLFSLSMGSRVALKSIQEKFAVTQAGHYVIADHLVSIDRFEIDFVAVAERFLGIPYYWGGKTSLGLDCSGLVQVSLDAAGINVPRDTDLQEKSIGYEIPVELDFSELKRGDLIFWKGHVGIMRDADTLLHASGHQMLVVSEPLMTTCNRILASGGGSITSIRRIS